MSEEPQLGEDAVTTTPPPEGPAPGSPDDPEAANAAFDLATPPGMAMSYRGRAYALGYSREHYAVWILNVTIPAVVQGYPKDATGWAEAWARFHALEAAATPPPEPSRPLNVARDHKVVLAALALLVAGVAVGVAGLFFNYLGGQSLVQQTSSLTSHIFYLAGWSLAALLIALRGRRAQAGTFLSLGLSATTFGLFVADAATALTSGTHSAGLGIDLGLTSWALCAAGSACAAWAMWSGRVIGRIVGASPRVAFVAIIAALGTAITFAPPWDRFVLYAAASGQSQVATAGNAFANPGAVIAGNVIVMACVAFTPILAVLWRPRALGAFLLGGVALTMVAQIASALVEFTQPPGPASFGISSSVAALARLHITAGFTWVFYVYCAFTGLLLLLCATLWRDPVANSAAAAPARAGDHAPLAIG